MHLLRTKIKGEIIAEFLPPFKKDRNELIILCGGMPSLPSQKRTIEFLAKKGFFVVFPRYRGTWESFGEFLGAPTEKDIFDLLDHIFEKGYLQDAFSLEKIFLKPKKIFIVGSSFGGAVALLSLQHKRVDKVFVLSPVVDFTKESEDEPLDDLKRFIKDGFGFAYRISNEGWKKLKKGEILNPLKCIDKISKDKVFVVHTQDDKIVMPEPVKEFVKKLGCEFKFLRKGGHLSLSKITKFFMYRRMIKFFKK